MKTRISKLTLLVSIVAVAGGLALSAPLENLAQAHPLSPALLLGGLFLSVPVAISVGAQHFETLFGNQMAYVAGSTLKSFARKRGHEFHEGASAIEHALG